jgi:hypothetical protein
VYKNIDLGPVLGLNLSIGIGRFPVFGFEIGIQIWTEYRDLDLAEPYFLLYIYVYIYIFYIGLVLSPNIYCYGDLFPFDVRSHYYDKQGACKFTSGMHIFIFFITNGYFHLLFLIYNLVILFYF